MNHSRSLLVFVALAAVLLVGLAGCLLVGAVDIPAADVIKALTGADGVSDSWRYIVTETRLPGALTAIVAGAALSVAGLLMQTTFDNPLAGPSILGISTGASLGVAIVMMAIGASVGVWAHVAVLGAALLGAMAVMTLLLTMSALVRSATMLLIVGILIGYLASSVIALLNFAATRESVHSFVVWGLGSFNSVTRAELAIFAAVTLLPLLLSMLYGKTLNALLLGERYAASTGVNVKRARRGLLVLGGILTAFVTAWCGPIGFIGLIVPHIARLLLRTSNHTALLPATALAGAAVGVLCQLISVSPGQAGIIPVNAITPIIGVPIIIYIIIRRRSIFYFN